MILAAHFFMIFGALFVFAIILIGILALGVILLTIGLISRHLNKKKDIKKKYAKICITLGSVFTVIPLVILGVILVTYVIDSKNGEYNPYTYDPHESNSLQDEEYCKEIMTEVIRCLDEEDAEGLKSLFSDYSIANSNLDAEIDEAMKIYEGKSISFDKFWYNEGGYHVNNGYFYSKGARIEIENLFTDEGREYYIEFTVQLVQDDDPTKEGLIMLWIREPNDKSDCLIRIGDVNY